jgi:hypothetical protein
MIASADVLVERPVARLARRRRLLDLDGGAYQFDIRPAAADRKVGDGPGSLDAVVGVGGNFEFAERIAFGARFFTAQSVRAPAVKDGRPCRGN